MKFIAIATCTVVLLVAAVAAQCTVTTPNGTVIDLSQVPVASLRIDQEYQGATSLYTWVISLCQAVNQPPSGAAACDDGAGYVSQYGAVQCFSSWTMQSPSWIFDAATNVASALFVNSNNWPLTINVGCGTGVNLKAVGDVDVSTALSFTMNLTSSVLCTSPRPPPPPSPRPTGELIQSTCSDPTCASCFNSTTPLGVCVESLSGGSLIAACSESSAILTIFPFSSACSGAANVTELPLNQCNAVSGANGGFISNHCGAFKAKK